MKRWGAAFVVAMAFAVAIVLGWNRSQGLLSDTDTRVMIQRIEQRNAPLSWWTGDWPLENHFYRPVVASLFELDLKLSGWNANGYAITNAVLCALCLLSLFWFLRELTNSPTWSAGATAVWGLWHLGPYEWMRWPGYGLVFLGLLIAVLPGRKLMSGLAVAALGWFAASELVTPSPFRGGMIDWIPGRTASAMALFCFLSMAAYARYERLTATRTLPSPTPEDPPATRSSEAQEPRTAWPWAVVAVACGWLAFSSYEQAVMLPAALLGVAVAFRLRGFGVRWGWQAAFWGLIPLYWLARKAFLPETTSAYQRQQFRTGPDVYYTVFDYVFPPVRPVASLIPSLELGPFAVLPHWGTMVLLIAVVAVVWMAFPAVRARKDIGVWLLTGWALSCLAFLPMAWLKSFTYNHYHYWPTAFRALFAVALLGFGFERFTRAWSRPAPEAPRRRVPAPGSLPRP